VLGVAKLLTAINCKISGKNSRSFSACNTCERSGRPVRIEGTARVVPGSNNSKLKVRFFWPFEGDYWILDLDPSYRWAAVGHPNRKYLWILARSPQLEPDELSRIRQRMAAQGYDITRLRPTPRSG
jgi:apolipoprotein D and lipocalin family protein